MAEPTDPTADEFTPDPAYVEAWEKHAEDILLAALGRAETDLRTDPAVGKDFNNPHPVVILLLRSAMMCTALAYRNALVESGFLFPEGGKVPERIPALMRLHAQQTRAAFAEWGLVDPEPPAGG
jgi:hypothetical protein